MVYSRAAWIAGSGLLLSALLILWIGNATNIDIMLADAAFDKVTHSFPMQHAWLAEKFNHVILKMMLSALAAFVVVLALWGWGGGGPPRGPPPPGGGPPPPPGARPHSDITYIPHPYKSLQQKNLVLNLATNRTSSVAVYERRWCIRWNQTRRAIRVAAR
jgi:hypothetical protein